VTGPPGFELPDEVTDVKVLRHLNPGDTLIVHADPDRFPTWEGFQEYLNLIRTQLREGLELPDTIRIVVLAGADLEVAEGGTARGS
jgi:hypothetical protein